MKLEVTTTSVKQEGNAVLGTKEKELYYLIIGEMGTPNSMVINVGQKTYERVKELTTPRETKTVINVFPDETKK